MPPRARRTPAVPVPVPADAICISDDEQDEENEHGQQSKRQKLDNSNNDNMGIDEDVEMVDATAQPAVAQKGNNTLYKPSTNTNLKGRKRFAADFADAKKAGDVEAFGVKVAKLRAGDDEGSFEIKVSNKDGHVLGVNFLISDTSDYPTSHNFFAYTEDNDLSSALRNIIDEKIGEYPSKPLQDTLCRFITDVAKALGYNTSTSASQHVVEEEDEEEELEDDGEAYDPFEGMDDDDFPSSQAQTGGAGSALDMAVLQRDFLETMGATASYRPALQSYGSSDFSLSVSTPILTLAEAVPPQALIAWDSRLLNPRNHHLCLLIFGMKGVWPILRPDGSLNIHGDKGKGGGIRFKVGLTKRYKPSRENAREAGRTFGLVSVDDEESAKRQVRTPGPDDSGEMSFDSGVGGLGGVEGKKDEEEEVEDEGRFEKFALSDSLETLMDQKFLGIVENRIRFKLGWAGAETLFSMVEKTQRRAEDVFRTYRDDIIRADKEEYQLAQNNELPPDPLRDVTRANSAAGQHLNFMLIAFCYLVRRLTLCTRYCTVCHNPLRLSAKPGDEEYAIEVLKPTVCEEKLCVYQYYVMGRGPSLEYEILHNPSMVDLLVSLAYSAAAEGVLDDPLPLGMGMRVRMVDAEKGIKKPQQYNRGLAFPMGSAPVPANAQAAPDDEAPTNPNAGGDGLVDFDELGVPQMRAAIVGLIESLPTIYDMKKHLEKKVKPGKVKPKLKDMDSSSSFHNPSMVVASTSGRIDQLGEKGAILPAAWLILRWIVLSCTAYIEEITNEKELVKPLDNTWRQFRFSVGAPDAESKFQAALKSARQTDANANKYPSLYAFHGSPLRNWHSIIRHGLWAKTITHGRAYGNGVYLAKEGQTSTGGYAQGSSRHWRNSMVAPSSCTALAEIVNLPAQFVSNNPHFVIKDTHWIMCRYLLVKCNSLSSQEDGVSTPDGNVSTVSSKKRRKHHKKEVPLFKFDPAQKITMGAKPVEVPESMYRVETLLEDCREDFVDEENDDEDTKVFSWSPSAAAAATATSGKGKEVIEISDEEYDDDDVAEIGDDDSDFEMTAPKPVVAAKAGALSSSSGAAAGPKGKAPVKDDWKHDREWVESCMANLFPPPVDATPGATNAVQKELRQMMKEQKNANSLRELGWHMPEEFIGDNLFQWVVELHSFDEDLPIAKDMKKHKVNSIVFEIRFPPTFPMSPPFFMIKGPRFLPFIQGGGGHVTGGGSICMDLLTADGWLPSYSVSAILMQIKLAISNLDPRPARLAPNWQSLYNVHEALTGYKRAAATHGWQVPEGLDKLIR